MTCCMLLVLSLFLPITRSSQLLTDLQPIPDILKTMDESLVEIDSMMRDIQTGRSEVLSCSEFTNWQLEMTDRMQNMQAELSLDDGCLAVGGAIEQLNEQRIEMLNQLSTFSDKMDEMTKVPIPEILPDSSSLVSHRPKDCAAAQTLGMPSGVTTIYPDGKTSKEVRCDQDSDGGGWTILILRQRQDPQLDFVKDWDEYYRGFGDPSGEYWLGLGTMQVLTDDEPNELRVTMARGTETATSYYSNFKVEKTSSAKLQVSGYDELRSTGGDALSYHNGMSFTARDRDRDGSSGGNCAHWSGNGGWWFNYCYFTNPTGVYGGDRAMTATSDRFLEWRQWQGYYAFLTDFALMIRPRLE